MNNTRIVHLTSVHPPYDTRIYHKECCSLADFGNSVTLICCADNDKVINSIKIRAIKKPQSRKERMLLSVWRICRVALKENAVVYHFHDPELIPVGMLLKLRGKRVIYDVHEDLPKQILSKEWIPRPLRRLVAGAARVAEAVASRAFDGIVAATPAIARRFPPSKTVVVQNFPILNELITPASMPYQKRPAKIVYVGGITAIRGIREMVQAMSLLPESLSNTRLVLAGEFSPPSLEAEVRCLPGWDRVEFLVWQDRASVARLLGEARIGLVLFHPVPNHVEAQPNKLFEYMSTGLPVIASDFPLWREIVDGIGCGLLVNPLDPRAIAGAIQYLLTHPDEAEEMGRRGQEAVYKKYNWDVEKEKLLSLYRRLI